MFLNIIILGYEKVKYYTLDWEQIVALLTITCFLKI